MQKNKFKEQIDQYYRLIGETTQLYEKWAKKRGITYNTILVLCTLMSEEGSCTQKQICDKWNIPKQTVRTILKDFEDKGYVTFSNMLSNRKFKIVALTESGLDYSNRIATEFYTHDFLVIEKMGIEKMETLNTNLALYIKHYRDTENA